MSAPTTAILDGARGGRAMTWVLAIMLFLTMLGVAAGIGTARAAATLGSRLSGRVSVQIATGDPAERGRRAAAALAALRASPDVAAARAVPAAEVAALLRPWLGDDAGDPDLPVPALIDVDLADPSAAGAARVAAMVRAAAPDALTDRQGAAMAPVKGLLATATAVAFAVTVLLMTATGAVVMLAVRAGLETHRATIQVMHALGATDVQVARLFQRRIARDAAIGGVVAALSAAVLLLLAGWRAQALGSELIAGIALGVEGWIVLLMLPFAYVGLAALTARLATLATLGRTL